MKDTWFAIGAGSIGRTVIGPLAEDAGLDLVFGIGTTRHDAAVVEKRVETFAGQPEYTVRIAAPRNHCEKRKVRVSGIINLSDEAALFALITSPQLKVISTSVRFDGLEGVAAALAPFVAARCDSLLILPFENIEQNGDYFRACLEAARVNVSHLLTPNVIVDCMVSQSEDPLIIPMRERYLELLASTSGDPLWDEWMQSVLRMHIVWDSVTEYRRKIIGVSAVNSGIAWLGSELGLQYLHQAVGARALYEPIRVFIKEIEAALVRLTRAPARAVQTYLETTLLRVENEYLLDETARFYRNLAFKLGPGERFSFAAQLAMEGGVFPETILRIMAIGVKRLAAESGHDPEKIVKDICRFPPGMKGLETFLVHEAWR